VALEIRDAILARETGLSPADDGDTAQAPPEPAPEPATPEGGDE
jgi:hypothetical protein